jgi:hypothetical protein
MGKYHGKNLPGNIAELMETFRKNCTL